MKTQKFYYIKTIFNYQTNYYNNVQVQNNDEENYQFLIPEGIIVGSKLSPDCGQEQNYQLKRQPGKNYSSVRRWGN